MNQHPPSDASLFLLLFYVDRGAADPGPEAWQRRVDDFNDWARAVETRGELVLAETIAPGSATAWVTGDADDDPRAPAAGPAAGPETSDDVGVDLAGLCIVRVRDLTAATELARRAPPLGPGHRAGIRAIQPA